MALFHITVSHCVLHCALFILLFKILFWIHLTSLYRHTSMICSIYFCIGCIVGWLAATSSMSGF